MKRIWQTVLGALLGAAIASCGGGGNTVAEGGIGGTGISSGSISAFGSIVVNGTKFDVNAAGITVNGDPNASRDDLDIGYVVRVDGDLDDGVADKVRFEANLIGKVDANNIPSGETAGTLTVMQQTVQVTSTTVINGTDTPDTIRDSNDGTPDRVLVSGYRNSAETIVATHLALNPAAASDQIVGKVDTTGSGEFTINGLVIKTTEEPDPDDRVLVRGDYDPGTGELTPTAPIQELEDLVSAGTEIELEGIVDRFNTESDFDVNGVIVDAGNAIIVDETGAPATLQEDVEAEVEGSFDSAGILVAERVEVELEDNVEIVARVANDPGPDGPVEFFNAGTGALLSVAVTGKTRLRDKSDNSVDNFSVADLAQNDWVELDAFEDAVGDVTALKIERFTPQADERANVEAMIDEKEPMDMSGVLEVLGARFCRLDPAMPGDCDTAFDLSGFSVGDEVELEWVDDDSFSDPQPVDSIEMDD